jgi:uncharacterized protein
VKHVFILLIRFYQYTFAALLGGQCRFHPSCSEYAVECFKQHNTLKAAGLTVWRILRCQPFSKGGYDPVPDPDKAK